MQAKQILMFENRDDLYNWLVNSDLAMTTKEIKDKDNKKSLIIPPLMNIVTYEDYVNYFQCDNIQTMAWSTKVEGQEKPQVSLIPIHIASMQYVPKETPTGE